MGFLTAAIVVVAMFLTGCDQSTDVQTKELPSVVGMHLDKAMDQLKKAGYNEIKSVDRKSDRSIIVKSNWTVVDETPTPVSQQKTDVKVVLGVLKSDEVTTTTTAGPTTTAAQQTTSTAPPTTSAPPTTAARVATTTTVASSAYYANCDAARAAGAAPIYRGEPGYSSKLDRDNDGVACE